jgi:hypothetical protein
LRLDPSNIRFHQGKRYLGWYRQTAEILEAQSIDSVWGVLRLWKCTHLTPKSNLTQVLDVNSSVMTRLIGTGPSALESQKLGVPKSSKIFPKFELFFLTRPLLNFFIRGFFGSRFMFSNWKFDGELESGLKPKGGQPEMGQKCFPPTSGGTSKVT